MQIYLNFLTTFISRLISMLTGNIDTSLVWPEAVSLLLALLCGNYCHKLFYFQFKHVTWDYLLILFYFYFFSYFLCSYGPYGHFSADFLHKQGGFCWDGWVRDISMVANELNDLMQYIILLFLFWYIMFAVEIL